jgi:prepilin-type processing-associated H-X9-DG protein
VNNLKQIGLAMHNYHGAVGSLPWGHGPLGWNDWSAHVFLLPYMEQGALYNTINFANGINAANPGTVQNTTAQRTVINAFLCPSDTDKLTNAESHLNYTANDGNLAVFYGNNPAPNGLFAAVPDAKIVTFADITDGLSNTAAFSERVKGIGNGSNNNNGGLDMRAPTSTWSNLSAGPANLTIPDPWYTACLPLDPRKTGTAQASIMIQGEYWFSGHMMQGRYNHIMPPNKWSCNWNNNNNGNGASTVSSHHSGGVNVLMADGSVKFIKDSISAATWWALGSKDGGEVISSDSY